MKKAFLSIAALLMLAPSVSMACSVSPWAGEVPPTPQIIADKFLSSPAAFFGKVGLREVIQEDNGTLSYTMDVLKQYAGDRVKTITAITDQSSSCAFTGQDSMTTLLYIPEGQTQPYDIDMTSNYFYGVPEQEIEAYLDAKQTAGE